MVHFSPSIEQQNKFTIAKLTMWVWRTYYNEQKESFMCLQVLVNKSLTW